MKFKSTTHSRSLAGRCFPCWVSTSGISTFILGVLLLVGSPARAQWTNYIECEDYNFNSGQFISDATDGMNGAYAGGVYTNAVGTQGVDYFVNSTWGSAPPSPNYRYADCFNNALNIWISGISDTNRAGFSVDQDYRIGWQNDGEWQNYTRNFSNAVYRVELRAGSGNATDGMKVNLEQVTSDPTASGQTTEPVGTVWQPQTGGYDVYVTHPFVDALGLPVYQRLSGTNTLRLLSHSSQNLNYFTLVAMPGMTVMPPYVISASPAPNDVVAGTTVPIDITIRHGDYAVDNTQVHLAVGGSDVTASTTISPSVEPGGVIVHYDYTVSTTKTVESIQLIYADTGSTVTRVTNNWTFKLPGNVFFIEAEDFNHDAGQFISDASDGMDGIYYGNAYNGFNAVSNVDYFAAGGNQFMFPYRTDVTGANLSDVDFLRFTYDGYNDLSRAGFNLLDNQDYMLIWCQAGDWQNYTRTFSNSFCYTVTLRAAAAVPDVRQAQLGIVTSDRTVSNQTVQAVGQFAITGIDNVHQFSGTMVDLFGNPRAVRLSGTTTLRLTELGKIYPNYIRFDKTTDQVIPPWVASFTPAARQVVYTNTPINLTITKGDNSVNLSSVQLWFNGANVTSSSTVTSDGNGGATVLYNDLLTPGTTGTVSIVFADSGSSAVWTTNNWTFSRFAATSGTYFIEAEDFNHDGGQFISDASDGMDGVYYGNAYFGSNGVSGIDYFAAGSDFQNYYRSNFNGGTPRFPFWGYSDPARLNFSIPDNQDYYIFPSHVGDWQNYTRNFYDSGCYAVTLRAAAQPGQGHAELGIVTSDPTVTNQTVQVVGEFTINGDGNVAQYSGSMVDAVGHVKLVRLSGTNTLRLTELGAFPNYLKFVKTTNLVITPWVPSATPASGQSIDCSTTPINLAIAKGDNALNVSSVHLLLNGTDVTSTAMVASDGNGGATVVCTNYYLLPGTATLTLVYADSGSPANWVTNTWTFSQATYPAGTVFIEAEDFNYGSGQYISDATDGMSGPYNEGAYLGLAGTVGVDFHSQSWGNPAPYRPGSGSGADGIALLDIHGYGGGAYNDDSRGLFSVTQDLIVGYSQLGDWQNYTREFPDAWYMVYIRSGTPGPGNFQLELGIVTSVRSQPNQTVKTINGRFIGAATGNSLSQRSARLNDALGNPIVLHLAGTNTLRLTSDTVGTETGLLYLVPVPASKVAKPPFVTQQQLSITPSAGNVTLSWVTAGWRVQSCTNLVTGTWSDVPGGSSSPVTVPATGTHFFRLVQ